jgi:hypothetical protein
VHGGASFGVVRAGISRVRAVRNGVLMSSGSDPRSAESGV